MITSRVKAGHKGTKRRALLTKLKTNVQQNDGQTSIQGDLDTQGLIINSAQTKTRGKDKDKKWKVKHNKHENVVG